MINRDVGAIKKEACKACDGDTADCFYAGDLRFSHCLHARARARACVCAYRPQQHQHHLCSVAG